METAEIFGIKYAVGDIRGAVSYVLERIEKLSGGYICFSNVFTVVTAEENKEYKQALNEASITFPDGGPIAHKLRKKGAEKATRIAGPDFMEDLLKETADGSARHFFYGSSEDILDRLQENLLRKFPEMNIVGVYSPPFRDLTDDEDRDIMERINAAQADIIWVGLGAPKQEMFMYRHKGKIQGLMIGVGAGFDYQAGVVKRAPEWMQEHSLEWLHRLVTDPGRLFRRYLVTNTKFIWYSITRRS